MSRFDDLEVFAKVVVMGSMSAAAREMGLSPAVISKRMQRLEERLGTRLLNRTTRQISLTESGQGYYERVVAILAGVEEAEAFVARRSSLARGVLKISAPTSFGRMHIAPHLVKFMRANPELHVNLELSDTYVDIVSGGFDLAVRIGEQRAARRQPVDARRLRLRMPAQAADPIVEVIDGDQEDIGLGGCGTNGDGAPEDEETAD